MKNSSLYPPLSQAHATTLIAESMRNHKPSRSTATFVRPANTTAYAAGDVIYPDVPAEGTQIKALEFPDVVNHGGTSLLLWAGLWDFATQSTALDAELHLFAAPLGVAPVDNQPLSLAEADVFEHLGIVTFSGSTVRKFAGRSFYDVVPNLVIQANESASIYGVLVAKNAYVPVSGEKFLIILGAIPRTLSMF